MGTFFKCSRCGNEDPNKIGYKNGKPYCRACISFRGATAIETNYKPQGYKVYIDYELSKEQQALSDEILNSYINKTPCLITAVCGSGKTEIVLQTISYVLKNGGRVGFAIPRVDVVREIKIRLEEIFKDNNVIGVYGGHNDILLGDIVCLTTHQIFSYENYFDFLILDEIDAFPYRGNETLQNLVLRSVKGSHAQMSATASKDQIKYYEEKGWPVLKLDKRYHGHPLPVPRLVIKNSVLKYYELYKELKRFEYLNKQVFLFVPTIKESEQLFIVLKHILKKVNIVHSKKADRKEIIEAFKNKKSQTLITTSVLERGVTVKDLQVIVFHADSPLYDSSVLIQIAGRVGRKKDAPTGEVIFIASKSNKAIEDAIDDIKKRNKTL